jgi:hypothetical protein
MHVTITDSHLSTKPGAQTLARNKAHGTHTQTLPKTTTTARETHGLSKVTSHPPTAPPTTGPPSIPKNHTPKNRTLENLVNT